MFYQLNYARLTALRQAESAESQNRTGDTAIFSRVLYQLSYLGLNVLTFPRRREYFNLLLLGLSSTADSRE